MGRGWTQMTQIKKDRRLPALISVLFHFETGLSKNHASPKSHIGDSPNLMYDQLNL
jgi:hypothetical protein